MLKRKELPSVERLRELFAYDDKAGVLISNKTNKTVGTFNYAGYLRTSIDGKSYQLHRVIWKLVKGEEPPFEIDHINRDRADNRIENLRSATRTEQCWNSSTARPFPGANRCTNSDRYESRIMVNGVRLYLGRFDTKEQASEAYLSAARDHFGEFFCAG